MLFFERLDPEEVFEPSRDFSLNTLTLDQLYKKAKKHDILNSSNIEAIYGAEAIEKQKAIEQELAQQHRQLNPELAQTQPGPASTSIEIGQPAELQQLYTALRRKYMSAGVFMHACPKCKNHGMLLHMPACVCCDAPNAYFEQI